MLVMPNKDVWTFNAYEDEVEIEESVYLAGNDGPRRTLQIVIYGEARKVLRVQWTFASRGGASAARRGDEPSRRCADRVPSVRPRPIARQPDELARLRDAPHDRTSPRHPRPVVRVRQEPD